VTEPSQLDRIEAMLKRLLIQTGPRQPAEDEKVFKDLSAKYWNGDSFKGCRLSECSAAFLRAYARYKSACAYMGRKENKPEKLQYVERDEKSAKLAAEWAAYREASGDAEPAPSGVDQPARDLQSGDFAGDDGIPF
jgi:hypothetical protein